MCLDVERIFYVVNFFFFSENQRKKTLNGHRIRETNQNTSSSMRRRLGLVKDHVRRIVLSGTNFYQS